VCPGSVVRVLQLRRRFDDSRPGHSLLILEKLDVVYRDTLSARAQVGSSGSDPTPFDVGLVVLYELPLITYHSLV